ncbi:MAG: Zn-ribbon domain-containing OB-fold protein [Deltaproteobacteria bacterium]|nr:Zn-ribbon domain-containing OB-fold protein [Deltaproteobacteria bacterium]
MADDYKAPRPTPTPDNAPFWEALRKHELHVQRCRDCGQAYFYPRNACPGCLSGNVEWIKTSGRGRLHTFSVVHVTGRNPPLEPPYVLAMVELEEGPKLLTNLVGVEPDPAKIRCDMAVVVEYADVTAELTLPRFRPAS